MASKPTPIPVNEATPGANPGDEAPAGTPGTGEVTCPACHGTGECDAKPCPDCAGTGLVVKAIGGA